MAEEVRRTPAKQDVALAPRVIRFGDFEFSPQTGELRKHGLKVKLEPQASKILLLLLERPGRICARQELQQHLWQDNTLVDFERNLYKGIHTLRGTLGDSATAPRYIETVTGRGYRFIPIPQEPSNPLSVLNNWGMAAEYYVGHDYKDAVEAAKRTLEIDPKYPDAVAVLGGAYEQIGDYKQAMEQWVKLEQLQGHEAHGKELMVAFEKSGYMGYLRKDAKDSEAEGNHYRGALNPSAAADYAMLSEKDAAFAALEKAFATRTGVVDMNVDPRLDKLHSDPRYADLLRRVGLPQ